MPSRARPVVSPGRPTSPSSSSSRQSRARQSVARKIYTQQQQRAHTDRHTHIHTVTHSHSLTLTQSRVSNSVSEHKPKKTRAGGRNVWRRSMRRSAAEQQSAGDDGALLKSFASLLASRNMYTCVCVYVRCTSYVTCVCTST